MSDYFQTHLDLERNSTLNDISSSLHEANWLQRKSLGVTESNLDVSKSNLDINTKKLLTTKRNAILLQEIKDTLQVGFKGLSAQIGYQISSLSLQLENLSNLVEQKTLSEERENFARDIIFNLKKIDESLSKKTNKKYIALEAKELLEQIDNFKIDTQSFTQIQDKEYFSSTLESIQSKYDAISEDEKKEIDNFSEVYFSVKVALKKLEEIEKIKLVNFPDRIEEKEKPEWNGILLIEGELHQELKNPYRTLDLRGPQLKKWISKIDEFPDLIEKFFEAKQKYTIQEYEFSFFQEIHKSQEKAKEYTEFLTNLLKCIDTSNDYIQKNPEFAESYPSFDFKEPDAKIVDYENLLKEQENKLNFGYKSSPDYLKLKALLREKMNGAVSPNEIVSNNSIQEKGNKIFVLIVVFSILALISIMAYKFGNI